MVPNKRRNHLSPENLETLVLLAAFKIPAKSPYEYDKEIELVENCAKKVHKRNTLFTVEFM